MNETLRRGRRFAVRVFAGICSALIATAVHAADTTWEMRPMTPNLDDKPSLQNGARLYSNFCLGCHSLQYQRYERVASDLEIPKDLVKAKLIFTGQEIGEQMTTSMNPELSKKWFGSPPPDLTMVTRVRDPEWVYNFLTTFYIDESRPFGVNNKVYPNVFMPHVLLPLQGIADEVCIGMKAKDILDGSSIIGVDREPNCPEVKTRPGTGLYSDEEFHQAAYDIANFLHYVGEPTRQERYSLGWKVLIFLLVLYVLAYFLNRNYWKDVHGASTSTDG